MLLNNQSHWRNQRGSKKKKKALKQMTTKTRWPKAYGMQQKQFWQGHL